MKLTSGTANSQQQSNVTLQLNGAHDMQTPSLGALARPVLCKKSGLCKPRTVQLGIAALARVFHHCRGKFKSSFKQSQPCGRACGFFWVVPERILQPVLAQSAKCPHPAQGAVSGPKHRNCRKRAREGSLGRGAPRHTVFLGPWKKLVSKAVGVATRAVCGLGGFDDPMACQADASKLLRTHAVV